MRNPSASLQGAQKNLCHLEIYGTQQDMKAKDSGTRVQESPREEKDVAGNSDAPIVSKIKQETTHRHGVIGP